MGDCTPVYYCAMAAGALDRITVERLAVPLSVPYRLAFGPVERFDTLIVECAARDGRQGLGEATVLTGYTDETIEQAWRTGCEIADRIAGLDAQAAKQLVAPYVASQPFTATAFGTALEMLQGSPILAVAREIRVPVLGMLNASGEEAIGRLMEQLLGEGYRTLKVKVGTDAGKDIEHVRTVQRLLRGRARIRIDANQGFSAEDGVAFVRALDPAGVELFEQPCAAADWEAHLAVVRAAGVPMMLDESIYGMADIERAAELEAARYIKLKLMKLGSLGALVAALERIRALGMTPVLGNGVACDPGCWMEACVAARHLDNAGEMNGFLKARAQLFAEPLQVHDAAIILKPGFVPRLAHERIAPYVLATYHASGQHPRIRRA